MKIKTYRFAAAVAVLLALCLVFMAPVGAEDGSDNDLTVTVDTAGKAQAALDSAVDGTTIQLVSNVDYGTLYLRPVDGQANTKTSLNEADGVGYTNYRNEYLRTVENLTIIGADGAKVDAIVVESGYIVDSGSSCNLVVIKNLVIDSIEFTDDHTNPPHSYAAPIFVDLSYADVDGLTVKNCKLIGNNDKMNFVYFYSSGKSVFDNVASNIRITGNTVDGIARLCELRQTENVIITDNVIKNTALHGILLPVHYGTYNGDITITGNTADSIGDRFVRMAGSGDANVVITGNTITKYLGKDADFIKVTDSTVTLTIKDNTITYGSAAAVKAALEAENSVVDTITLDDDIVLTDMVNITKTVTLDLNGYSLTASSECENDSLIIVKRGGVLTIEDSSADKTGSVIANAGSARVAVKMTMSGETDTSKVAKLVVNGGTLEGSSFGITGNGNPDRINTEIIINGGAVIGSTGIYHPQDGKLTINGGTVTGETGIEMRAGSLTVTGGEITGNGNSEVTNPNGSGTTTDGVGIAVVQHTTQKKIDVAISGGTIKGHTALYQNDTQGNGAEHAKNITISVSGGTFTAINGGVNSVFSADKRLTITGGTFSSNPSAYIASGYEVVQPGDKYLVQKYVDRSSSSSSSKPVEEPEEPVVEPETPAAPGEATVETEVTDGGEVELETPAAEGEGGSAATDEDEAKITGVVLPTGTDSEVTFVPVSEQPAPAGQEENTKKVFEINVPSYEKGKAAVIKFHMTVAELAADGKEAADVALWHFDEETGEWTKLVTSYVIVDGVVYFEAITNDFSPFAIIYEDEPAGDMPGNEPQDEPETPASPAPLLGVLAALGAAVVLRRK